MSALWTSLAVAILSLAAVLVFILQNPQNVMLSFLFFHGRLPLAIALLFAMMVGAVIVLAVGTARILQLRGVTRRARRGQAAAEDNLWKEVDPEHSVTPSPSSGV
ncbi:MAG: LapA family protein [Candidatus Dormibacteria bacterium]